MKIFLGADHRGFELKEKVMSWLEDWSYDYEDTGAFDYDKDDDYPDFGKAVAEKVLANQGSNGILICGSGIGISIAANRYKGIRAGLAINPKQVHDSVHDEDLNVLTISSDYASENDAKEIIKIFLETQFGNEERYIRRINKLDV